MSYMSLTTKVKVAKFSFLNEKSYNKPVIDFNFGRHKDLSTLKSDIHLGLAASLNYHFFVNNFIILHGLPEVTLQSTRHEVILYGLREMTSERQVILHDPFVRSIVLIV